jgi:hypothetical protein
LPLNVLQLLLSIITPTTNIRYLQEYERQTHEEQERQRQLQTERTAALAREIDEKKEEKRRIRIMDTPIDGPDYELIGDGGVMANVYSFDSEIKCKGFVFHSVGLSNPIIGMSSYL